MIIYQHVKELIINPEYSLEGLMLKLKLQYFGHLMRRADSFGKDPDAGKDWGQEEKGRTEDEMVGWHHRLSGHGFEQTPGDSEGQGSLVCCSPCGYKESDMTERLNWTELTNLFYSIENAQVLIIKCNSIASHCLSCLLIFLLSLKSSILRVIEFLNLNIA